MMAVVKSLEVDSLLDKIFRNSNAGGSQSLPANIKSASDRIKAAGGLNKLIDNKGQIPSKQMICNDMLQECQKMIDAEVAQDIANREKFSGREGFKWTAQASNESNYALVQELQKYSAILSKSENSNQIIEQKLNANHEGLSVLSKSDDEIANFLGPIAGG